ncbi:hypothetical protein M8C21_029740, partial [Ambrosia artemisiifolia]
MKVDLVDSTNHMFQENESIECTVMDDLIPFSLVHEDGRLREVEDMDDIMGRPIADISRGRGFVAGGGRGRGQGVMA